MKSGNLNFLEPSGPLQACNGADLPLQCIIEILTEIGRCRGMEMNVKKKAKVMRKSRQSAPLQKPENVEYVSYLCSMMTNDARCTRDVKSRIVLAKAAFN
jgi:hypothetical protein